MKWIPLTSLCFLLSSCIYTEGQIIREPEDVVISSKAYQLTPWYPCHSMDITNAERQSTCPE